MAKQNGKRPFEAQSEPLLPIPQGAGHTIEDFRNLWNHLEQLVREGRLQYFFYWPSGQGDQSRSKAQGNASSKDLLDTINVIFAAPKRTGFHPSRVMSVAQLQAEDSNFKLRGLGWRSDRR